MASPGLDVARLTDLGRELARLEPIVNAIRAWNEVQASLRSTRELAHDPDEEVRAMAREELTSLEARPRSSRPSCTCCWSRATRTTTAT